jgi:hypothetical protein
LIPPASRLPRKPPVTTPVRKRRRDLGCAVCCAPADLVSSGVLILYSFRCDFVAQLPLPIKHTSALLLEFVAPVKFCKAIFLMFSAWYCLGTHLQLVSSASFTYTDDKATGTACGKETA